VDAVATERDMIARSYREGVDALVAAAERNEAARSWSSPGCGAWTALETVRHVVVVSQWYHDWLDRALAGDAEPPFPWNQIEARNADELAALSDVDGAEATRRFGEQANAYLDRAIGHWDLPYGFPRGTVTVGMHLRAATAEWHLHAWDLDHAHRPSDPGLVLRGLAACVAANEPRGRRVVLLAVVKRASRRSPWLAMLRRSGRR
jgi:hypothetical protein